MVVKEEILNALKSAVEHSQSLKDAMTSLSNAGYNLNEIREAASALETIGSEKQIAPAAVPEPSKKSFFNKLFPEKKSLPSAPSLNSKQKFPKLPTLESEKNVEEKNSVKPKKSIGKIWIIILISLLIFLIGVLIFLFVLGNQF